jgi:hypothetical protein
MRIERRGRLLTGLTRIVQSKQQYSDNDQAFIFHKNNRQNAFLGQSCLFVSSTDSPDSASVDFQFLVLTNTGRN